MKIISAQLDLQSQHQQEKTELLHSKLRSWKSLANGQLVELNKESLSKQALDLRSSDADRVSLSKIAAQAAETASSTVRQQDAQAVYTPPRPRAPEIKPDPLPSPPPKALQPPKPAPQNPALQDSKMELMRLVVERFSGLHFELIDASRFKDPNSPGAQSDASAQGGAAANSAQAPQGERAQGWGVDVQVTRVVKESEQSHFQAKGIIRTADGQEFNVDVQLNMSRSFVEMSQVRVQAGDAVKKDPLVVNFAGKAAELTQRNFIFDLDMDGKSEQIAFVKPGSGFLALDKNGDGVINDGSELFGPTKGDGFAELAAYDEDGNRFIDEADSVYDKLRIWSSDAQGNKQLVALGQRGVGAIYLGKVATDFALRDGKNQQLGQLRSTSLYLKEDGGAGTVQQVDLVV